MSNPLNPLSLLELILETFTKSNPVASTEMFIKLIGVVDGLLDKLFVAAILDTFAVLVTNL